MATTKWRYIELDYRLPSDPDNTDLWMAAVLLADSPNHALREAKGLLRRAHPDAVEVEEFLQRTITPEKAEKISGLINSKQWAGWFDHSEDEGLE